MRQHHVLSTTTPDDLLSLLSWTCHVVCDTSCPIGKLPFSFLLCDEFLKSYFLSMPQLSKYVSIRPNERSRKDSKMKIKVLGFTVISFYGQIVPSQIVPANAK